MATNLEEGAKSGAALREVVDGRVVLCTAGTCLLQHKLGPYIAVGAYH